MGREDLDKMRMGSYLQRASIKKNVLGLFFWGKKQIKGENI